MVPTSVWATAGVSAMMVVSSALIMVQNVGLLPDVLYHDCLATQNLGHAAFLLGFATSAWRGHNVLGASMTYAAPRLLATHATSAAIVAVRFFEPLGLGAAAGAGAVGSAGAGRTFAIFLKCFCE